ncbi:MAG: glycosyltransferase family 2 protein [Thermodesulfobacteriaceae bacterium]|nr:glycosyltransferase family 2 protein [Thermodesulfobacteriaceae bacterium]MCX8040882.1 glycosyltransferase family 2 protein [Thermodesulfobacteriaceae bacterium]MDW8135219.1 glycosyltransferase family 2 protein [Thermodesulfobacterium sp.]
MSEIKFSIIIPTYNRINQVVEAIDSALNQICNSSYEVIVIDDGSTDGTEKFLSEYQKKVSNFRFLKHEKNRGVAVARNTGIKIAQGKYLLFLDSDDLLLPDALKTFEKGIELFPDGEVFIGKIIKESLDKKRKIGILPKLSNNSKKNLKLFLKKKIPIVAGSFIVKKDIIEKNLFPEKLRLREDFPIYGYLICLCKCYVLDKPVVIIREHLHRLRNDTELLIQRNLLPLQILYEKLPSEFQALYSLALSREYLSIFRSFYLLKEYKKAIAYYHKAIKIYPFNLFCLSYLKKYLKSLIKSL